MESADVRQALGPAVDIWCIHPTDLFRWKPSYSEQSAEYILVVWGPIGQEILYFSLLHLPQPKWASMVVSFAGSQWVTFV